MLRRCLQELFDRGPDVAVMRWSTIERTLKDQVVFRALDVSKTKLEAIFRRDMASSQTVQFVVRGYPWQSCKMTAILITLMCADFDDKPKLNAVMRQLGGLPTMAEILSTPSRRLTASLETALTAAAEGQGATCILANLVDVCMMKAGEHNSIRVRCDASAH